MKEINIALATDKGYLKQAIVVMESVMISGKQDNTYHFYLLTDVGTEKAFRDYKKRLCIRYNNCKIDCIIMEDIFGGVDIHISHITTPTYYRLLLPRLISCDRCIYLDCDVIVCRDLADMYYTEMNDCEVAGVVAPSYHKLPENGREYMQQTGLLSMEQYINAGVLLLHLANMRAHGFCEKVDLLLNKQFPTQDQDIINIVSYGYIKRLPYKYNFQVACLSWERSCYEDVITDRELHEAQEQPYIIHYSTSEKPWECFDISYADIWWEMCNKTIVYDEFYSLYKNSFYYYGIIKNKYLWQLEPFSEQWIEALRKYNGIYIYGAGKKGRKVIEYLLSNKIAIKAVLVSTMDNNLEYIQGIKVECLNSQVTDRDLVVLAMRKDYIVQVRRMLFDKGILNVINLEI